MTQEIIPDLENTEKLVEQVLLATVGTDSRVKFVVPAGQARLVIARVRTMMSRRRAKLKKHNIRVSYFRLNTTVHPETRNGIRYECIVLWREVTENQQFRSLIDKVAANG